jgi:hypothetical protein
MEETVPQEVMAVAEVVAVVAVEDKIVARMT